LTAFADLGLGNGLMTRLPPALANGDLALARRHVSSAYAVLVAVALAASALLWASLPFAQWETVFDPRGVTDSSDVNLLAVASLTAFALNVPCALVTRLYYAKQRAASAATWQTAASLAPLVPVLVAVRLDAGPLIVVVLATAMGPAVNAVNTLWFFARVSPELRPTRASVSVADMRQMLRLGAQFFGLTVALVVATSSDNLILAQTLGLTAVTLFSVPARVFLQLGQVVSLINMPLWSANAEALSRGDRVWIKRVMLRMVALSVVATVLLVAPFALFGRALIEMWTGQSLEVPLALTMGLAAWWIIMAALSPVFMVQNGAGVVRPQLVGWGVYAVLSIPAKALLATTWGVAAIPWVGAALLTVTVLPAALIGYHRVMRPAGDRDRAATNMGLRVNV
jgi:O-antigen/teichoic acid export membrane protein